MSRPRIAFIGAGSTVFARALLRDVLLDPDLRQATVRLMDIDPVRLQTTTRVAAILNEEFGSPLTILPTLERDRALDGADYVITMFQVGGYQPATVTDFEIPKRYGLRQTIGDTLGIGGIMRALRSVPVLVDLARDMERLCPGALLLNYSNPMAMLIWSVYRATRVPVVGLCHSVHGTAADIAGWLGVPFTDVNYLCAGINHMAFYLTFERDGQDLYPALRNFAAHGRPPAYERVRFDVLRRWGYFVTESSEHFSEYVPWYIKGDRPELVDRYAVPLDEYPARCEEQIAAWGKLEAALTSKTQHALQDYERERFGKLSGMSERRLAYVAQEDFAAAATLRAEWLAERTERAKGPSGEYGIQIIHAIETGTPAVIYGNVRNDGLIDNLPAGCCVEVPCLVDRNGIQPTKIGDLPPQLAALMRTNVGVQDLAVEAALTGNRDRVYQAAMLDPHTAAELDPAATESLVDELLAAHGPLVPAFA